VAGEVLIIQVVIWAYLIPNSFLSVVMVGELAAYTKNLVPAGPHRVTSHVYSPPLAYLQSGAASLSYIVTSRVPPQCGEVGPDGTAAAVRCSIRLRETRDTYHHTARNHPYNFARPRVCLCPRETKNNDQIRTLFHTDYCRFTPKQRQRHRTERTKKAVVIELSGKKKAR
jgi:hypothetical protein